MTHRFLATLSVTALIALSMPALVIAHAVLVESDPADGATLTTTPYTLRATFNEELGAEQSSIVVTDSAGQEVASGSVSADDDTVMVVELPAMPPGGYVVRWTAFTPDDAAFERGTFTFTVAAAAATPAPTAPPTSGGSGTGNDVLIALVLAAIGIAGVVLFVFFRGRR